MRRKDTDRRTPSERDRDTKDTRIARTKNCKPREAHNGVHTNKDTQRQCKDTFNVNATSAAAKTGKFPHSLAIVHPRCQPSLDLGRTSLECCAQYPILCCCRSTVSPWPSKDLHYSVPLGILRSQLLICHHFQPQSLGNSYDFLVAFGWLPKNRDHSETGNPRKAAAPGEARLNMSRQRITEACTVGEPKLRKDGLGVVKPSPLFVEAREAADKREVWVVSVGVWGNFVGDFGKMNQNHMKINIFSIQIDDAYTHGIVICKTPPCSERILRPWLPRRIVKPWQRKRRRRRKPLGCQKPCNDRENPGKGWEKMHQLWVGKEMGRLFFGCEFRKTPISQVIFWETFRIFECWSGFAIGQQKQGPRDSWLLQIPGRV